jgi:hypothetical protein
MLARAAGVLITTSRVGRPISARLQQAALLKPQPSDTSSEAPTFGCVHSRSIILCE